MIPAREPPHREIPMQSESPLNTGMSPPNELGIGLTGSKCEDKHHRRDFHPTLASQSSTGRCGRSMSASRIFYMPLWRVRCTNDKKSEKRNHKKSITLTLPIATHEATRIKSREIPHPHPHANRPPKRIPPISKGRDGRCPGHPTAVRANQIRRSSLQPLGRDIYTIHCPVAMWTRVEFN